LKQDDICSNTL